MLKKNQLESLKLSNFLKLSGYYFSNVDLKVNKMIITLLI